MYLEEKPDFKIYLAAFVMDVNQAIQQDGDLLYLNFKLKSGSGQSVETELSFTESPLAGGADGFDLPVDWEDGVVSIEKSVLPDEMVLKQNYPNPFNPSTIIEFSLPQAGAVTLTIYNIAGEAISVVVNQDLRPGVYRYNWDGSAFASGIYYYRLETNGHVMTKKLVMLH